ncbi:MAG: hypothetical protein NC489_28800, partial [Ruminococcus flavefaciens]|nr:hypothetical protein [Ruminococcus flavefaciens]
MLRRKFTINYFDHRYIVLVQAKITILCGESATGKTTVVENIGNPLYTDVPYTDVYTVLMANVSNVERDLSNLPKDTVVFMDEDVVLRCRELELLPKFAELPLYFVLVYRDPIIEIGYSYRDVYYMRTVDRSVEMCRVYEDFSTFTNKQSYLCEDEKSGYTYMSNYLDGCTCAGGNRKIPRICSGLHVFADGCAFGAYIADTLELASSVFLPVSFEYLAYKKLTGKSDRQLFDEARIEYKTLEDYFTVCMSNLYKSGYDKDNIPNSMKSLRLFPEFEQLPAKHVEEFRESLHSEHK